MQTSESRIGIKLKDLDFPQHIIQIAAMSSGFWSRLKEHSKMVHLLSASSFLIFLSISSTFQSAIPPQSPFGDALEAIFSVGVRLQTLLTDSNKDGPQNFLVSPLSVSLLISQLMLGADKELRQELYNLLSLPKAENTHHSLIYYHGSKKNTTFYLPYAKFHSQMGNLVRSLETKLVSKSFTLNCSNGLFINSNFRLKENFEHNLEIYQTEIQPLNFSTDPLKSQQVINDWANEQTRGVIKSIISTPLPPSTAAIFTNAIYFKAQWKTPFSFERNVFDSFSSTATKTVKVEYMQESLTDIMYVNSDRLGCTAIRLPYIDNEVAMYFILPHVNNGEEHNIKKFSERLTIKEFIDLLSEMKASSVTVKIPKLKLANSLSVLDPLERYRFFNKIARKMTNEDGYKDSFDILEERIKMFNNLASLGKIDVDLNEAVEDSKLKVSNLIQQVHLSVDEKGTEAAAISASIIEYIGGSKLFILNRPFAFMVRHESTSAVLFWGTVSDPSSP
ncbi:hypothetical protein FQR65_LT01547 [Abscondita terminalis]|nr:hypothetical protein FQR65_LT01547 [Abscondita terminalis]